MNITKRVLNRIDKYKPKGGLDSIAKFFLELSGVNHPKVREHVEGVALLAEDVAIRLNMDSKAAFFAGLLHDVGKIIFPYDLFDGHDINTLEYKEIKKHAIAGFQALEKLYRFTGLCAGIHHNLYNAGYGIGISDFPKGWGLATIKKVLDISMVVSICDFINAYKTRPPRIQNDSDKSSKKDLKGMLFEKYPENHNIVIIAIEESKKYFD